MFVPQKVHSRPKHDCCGLRAVLDDVMGGVETGREGREPGRVTFGHCVWALSGCFPLASHPPWVEHFRFPTPACHHVSALEQPPWTAPSETISENKPLLLQVDVIRYSVTVKESWPTPRPDADLVL